MLGSVTRGLDRLMFITVKRRKETLGNYLPLNRRTWGLELWKLGRAEKILRHADQKQTDNDYCSSNQWMNERSLRLRVRHTSMNPNDNKIKCRPACRPSTLHIRRQIINELPIRRQWGKGVVNQNDRLAVHFKWENNLLLHLMATAMCNSSAVFLHNK